MGGTGEAGALPNCLDASRSGKVVQESADRSNRNAQQRHNLRKALQMIAMGMKIPQDSGRASPADALSVFVRPGVVRAGR